MNKTTKLPQLDFTEAVKLSWSKPTQFTGRSRRSEFWWSYLALFIINIFMSFIPLHWQHRHACCLFGYDSALFPPFARHRAQRLVVWNRNHHQRCIGHRHLRNYIYRPGRKHIYTRLSAGCRNGDANPATDATNHHRLHHTDHLWDSTVSILMPRQPAI